MPTIRRLPRKSLDPRKPSEREIQLWEKHRELKGKPKKLPRATNK